MSLISWARILSFTRGSWTLSLITHLHICRGLHFFQKYHHLHSDDKLKKAEEDFNREFEIAGHPSLENERAVFPVEFIQDLIPELAVNCF